MSKNAPKIGQWSIEGYKELDLTRRGHSYIAWYNYGGRWVKQQQEFADPEVIYLVWSSNSQNNK